jgi:Raf kinase inhibitor-like YbhB/YbcL family protein
MKSIKYILLILILALAFACTHKVPEMADPVVVPKEFNFSTIAFQNDSFIPKKYTCDGGENFSPELKWENAPTGTRSLVLIMEDPDAERDTFVHWIVYDIPPNLTQLEENQPDLEILPNGMKQGQNSGLMNHYFGPCPPSGVAHRYFFKLYAIDTLIGFGNAMNKGLIEKKMQGHIIKQSQIIGKYQR